MKRLLFIAHFPSENTHSLAKSALNALSPYKHELQVIFKSPDQVSAEDLAQVDGILLGMIENLASMSGLMKDMFDRCYYAWLDQHQGLPCAVYIRAGHSGIGTARQFEQIRSGLSWRLIAEPLMLVGAYRQDFPEQTAEQAQALAEGLRLGIF